VHSILHRLWKDEVAFVASSEMVLLAAIAGIGLVAGLVAIRDAVVGELADVGGSVGELNHSYSFAAITTSNGVVNGSVFVDQSDFCEIEGNNDRVCAAANCIRICATAATHE
jgi:hypothetical protein